MKKAAKSKPNRRVADDILEGLQAASAHLDGKHVPGLVAHVPVAVDVAKIRSAQGLSQEAFAKRYGFTVGAVRDWEQKRRTPERSARILLKMIERNPDAVQEALKDA